MVTNGSGSGLKFFKIISFQHGTTYEMKLFWSLKQVYFISHVTSEMKLNILVAVIILFHGRCGSTLKLNTNIL